MPHLNLFLLGTPRVTADGQPAPISRRKAVALLAYLAMTGGPHSRDALAAFLWPDFDPGSAFAYLRTTLWTLNRALSGAVDAERDQVGLQPGYEVDVSRFRALAAGARAELEQAAALYAGDFMAGFSLPDSPEFDEWQLLQRESLRRELGVVLHRLVSLSAGETDAIEPARRWVALDPLNEAAQRVLMAAYQAAGQRAAALRQYETCRALLRRELDIEPEADTLALYHAIQAGQPLPEGVLLAAPPVVQAAPTNGARPAPRYTLPAQPTVFVGRERELADIASRLADPTCRLLTLIGPGGIGKTRLSLQAAAQAAPGYDYGACFVPLAPVGDAEYLLPAVADALDFTVREGDPKTQLLQFLAGKRLLLVMDNFEHLLDGAELVADMLRAAPGLTVLATSRERLGLQEEWLYDLEGLPYPHSDLCDFDDCAAVQLFLHSARRVAATFRLKDSDRPHVAHICQLVYGMPLGIELAAGWLPVLSPEDIAAEIERSLDFLAAAVRNLPPRHQSLQAVFATSWERLSPMEQRVLSRLAIFRGGFEREAAQAVADASLPLLLSLVGKSLVRRVPSGRFELHELIRQFAETRLVGDERDRASHLHSVYYARWLRGQESRLKGRDQLAALDAIEAEIGNLRAAWHRAAAHRDTVILQQLIAGMQVFYVIRQRPTEYKELALWALGQFGAGPLTLDDTVLVAQFQVWQAGALLWFGHVEAAHPLLRAAAHTLRPIERPDLALTWLTLADHFIFPNSVTMEDGRRWAQRALAAFEAQGDEWGIAQALRVVGNVYHHYIHYQDSRDYYRRSLEISRKIGDVWGEGEALKSLGEVAYTLGDYPEAERLFHDGAALSRTVGNVGATAWGLGRLAEAVSVQGRYDEALRLVQQAVELWQQLGNSSGADWQRLHLGWLAQREGRLDDARAIYRQSLATFRALDEPNGIIWSLNYLSNLERLSGSRTEAYRLAAESLAAAERLGTPWEQAGAYYSLGKAAMALDNLDEARQHLRWAVMLAAGAKSAMMLTRHLVGVARLWLYTGQPEAAAEILVVVQRHPATWQSARDDAERLLGLLPPDIAAAAQQREPLPALEALALDVSERLL